MRSFIYTAVILTVFATLHARAEDVPDAAARAKPKPLPTPTFPKFNSVVTKTPPLVAAAGSALTADGAGKSKWAKIKGTDLDSGTASTGMLLAADGNGGASWTGGSGGTLTGNLIGDVTGNVSGTASNVTGIVAIANGGTGSAVKNFVDLTTNQTAAGNKTFTGTFNVSTCFTVEARPNNAPANFPNTFIGIGAGAANTSGQANVFVGQQAGLLNSTGSDNTFTGVLAGGSTVGGNNDSFYGTGAGEFNAGGSNNSYFGAVAGQNGTAGSNNSCFGYQAGQNNTASNNTFVGATAGIKNTTGSANVFVGSGAGATCTTGQQNSFFGINAGNKTDGLASANPSAGSHNSFFGAGAGQANTTGDDNTTMGNIAGIGLTSGQHNTFFGGDSGTSITTENQNTCLGAESNSAAGNVNATAVGANAFVNASNSLVLGSVNGANGATSDTFVGIGVTAPNSYLQVKGSVAYAVRTLNNAGAGGLTDTDYALILTGTTATTVIIANNTVGRVYVVKNFTNKTIVLGPQSGLIEGNATINVPTLTAIQVICDGTNWFKIN